VVIADTEVVVMIGLIDMMAPKFIADTAVIAIEDTGWDEMAND
jgi:hypothetical protein